MSMISEQVNKIRKVAKCVYLATDKEVAYDISNTLNQAADTIEALSAKLAAANMERSDRYYNGGWILCEDRLPSKEECGSWGRSFNVTVIENELKTMTMTFEYEIVRGKEVCRWKWHGRLSPWKVIAWQPLPEPYRP